MRSLLPALAMSLALVPAARAGSVDNRNNNSAEYIRDLSRNAATEGADVSIYNPAGAVKLQDGLSLSLSNQTVAKFNQQSFAPTATARKITYTSDIVSPLYPTAFAVYKKDNWAAFAAFSFPGGGGELEYKKGSATTFPLETNLQTQKLNADAYLRSVYYGFTLGGSYAPRPWFSASLAARTLYARTDITDWILAVRYEAVVPLEWEVQRSSLNLDGVFKNDPGTRDAYIAQLRSVLRAPGTKFNRDLPAVLGLGAGYRILPVLRADLSMNVYFNSQADWGGIEDQHDDGYEFAAGLEYASDRLPLKLSASAQYTITGADQASYQLENPALNSISTGVGGRYGIGRNFGITLGWTGNFGLADKADFPALATTADEKKHVFVYAVGFDYHAF
ncbi:MAG: hypothetical protein JF616_17710 [Fibrobacteres bacterium]|nr:hypothetical protein [Fibrobacterota bacterium]